MDRLQVRYWRSTGITQDVQHLDLQLLLFCDVQPDSDCFFRNLRQRCHVLYELKKAAFGSNSRASGISCVETEQTNGHLLVSRPFCVLWSCCLNGSCSDSYSSLPLTELRLWPSSWCCSLAWSRYSIMWTFTVSNILTGAKQHVRFPRAPLRWTSFLKAISCTGGGPVDQPV